MTRGGYSDETKAACMAALLAGQSVSHVAEQYNIPKGTVSSWKHRGVGSVADVATIAMEATQKSAASERIAGLVAEFLIAELQALTAQAKAFADVEWIKKQPASEIAVLHGVAADKVFRILEAWEAVTTEPAAV